jgi:hypothetical protein
VLCISGNISPGLAGLCLVYALDLTRCCCMAADIPALCSCVLCNDNKSDCVLLVVLKLLLPCCALWQTAAAACAAVLCISGNISPGLAGLCLVYALDLTRYLKHGTAMASKTESDFNSVERVVQYLQVRTLSHITTLRLLSRHACIDCSSRAMTSGCCDRAGEEDFLQEELLRCGMLQHDAYLSVEWKPC